MSGSIRVIVRLHRCEPGRDGGEHRWSPLPAQFASLRGGSAE